jgi:hypothetical protein
MAEEATTPKPAQLFLSVDASNQVQIGTCEHCVREPGRPERAWNPDGDRELDFDREALIEKLRARGIQLIISDQYVCP